MTGLDFFWSGDLAICDLAISLDLGLECGVGRALLRVERFDLLREHGVGDSRQVGGITLGLFRRRASPRRHDVQISKI